MQVYDDLATGLGMRLKTDGCAKNRRKGERDNGN